VNGFLFFEVHQSASIHDRSAPHCSAGVNKGLLKRSDAFYVKYPYFKLQLKLPKER